MKTLLLAAAFATVLTLPALAQDTAAPAAPARGEFRQRAEAMHDHFKSENSAEHQAKKAKMEALRADCHSRMEAAKTPDAKTAVQTDCRARFDAMRKQFFDERTQEIDAHRAEKDQLVGNARAKGAELKAQQERMKALVNTPVAPTIQ